MSIIKRSNKLKVKLNGNVLKPEDVDVRFDDTFRLTRYNCHEHGSYTSVAGRCEFCINQAEPFIPQPEHTVELHKEIQI